jgi:hypothetical protein
MRKPPKLQACLLTVLLLASGTAHATGRFPDELAIADQQRLRDYAELRTAAIREARDSGSPKDVAELDAVLAGSAVTLAPAAMAGEWRCRVIKLGGMLPLTIYRDFRCRISDDAAGLRLEKLTGSQRTSGIFYDLGEARMGFAGAEAWGIGDRLRKYGENPERDQVGYLVPISAKRMRLELPLPRQESRFDILELRR